MIIVTVLYMYLLHYNVTGSAQTAQIARAHVFLKANTTD